MMKLYYLVNLLSFLGLTFSWSTPSPPLNLSQYEQEVFDVAMQIGDWSWEPSTGWIEVDDDHVSWCAEHAILLPFANTLMLGVIRVIQV